MNIEDNDVLHLPLNIASAEPQNHALKPLDTKKDHKNNNFSSETSQKNNLNVVNVPNLNSTPEHCQGDNSHHFCEYYDQGESEDLASLWQEYSACDSLEVHRNSAGNTGLDETLCEVAGNEPRTANQSTSSIGRKMYQYNSNAPVEPQSTPPKNRPDSDNQANNQLDESLPPLNINQHFLGDSIAKSLNQYKFLTVKSEKGTGKTTAIKLIIEEKTDQANILVVTPRKKLNLAIAHELNLNYYEDVKNITDKEERRKAAQRMVVTPQSLEIILRDFPDIKYDLIVMDESESVSNMLVSSVTAAKSKTIEVLGRIASQCSKLVVMDAALGVRTHELMRILSGGETVGELTNHYQRWNNIRAEVLTEGKYSSRVEAINSLQIQAIEQGEKIAISSSSREYCEQRYDVLSALFPNLKIGLFTSKSTSEVQGVLSNPSSVHIYDIIIFSPAVSIGVSFDIKDHFSTVYGVYPNTQHTADSDDAIQGLARIRHPSANKWVIVLDDDKHVFKHSRTFAAPKEIQQIITDRYLKAAFFAGCPVELSNNDNDVASLWSICQSYFVHNKNNFNQCFIDSIVASGVQVEYVDHNGVIINNESKELTKKSKEDKALKAVEAKTKSAKIDESEYQHLKALVKFRPDEVSQNQLDSMSRFRFENKFNIDCDSISAEQLDHYLALDENDAIGKCVNREVALSDNEFTKQFMKARIAGVSDTEAFKVDMLDQKMNYQLKKKLLDYAVPYFTGKEYSHASLKKDRDLVRFIERNYKEIVVTGVIPLPTNWKEKPAAVLNHLLGICGYNRVSKRQGKGKNRTTTYKAVADKDINDLCTQRRELGSDWVTSTDRLINLHAQILASIADGKTRLETLWEKAGRTDDMEAFLIEFKDDIELIENGQWNDADLVRIIQRF